MPDTEVNQLISHLFRHEAGKMVAVLTRIVGLQNLELAQDLVQDTLLKALHVWKLKGTPDNPSAWLYLVAKRKAIDAIRENKLHREIDTELVKSFQSEWTFVPAIDKFFLDHEIEDSQLRMMFVACHPSIAYESQIAFTLKTLCGLSVAEIAHSFLSNEETITKRLYRAREKIREEKISLEVPDTASLTQRLETVLHTLYLLFNEGYNASHRDEFIQHDLCEEAMRLTFLLTKNHQTNVPNVHALLALMCFQVSREKSRLDDDGNIVLLQEQDRLAWNKNLIEKGNQYLQASAASNSFSEYHLEAAIAACHANATSFALTDWKKIFSLYEVLTSIKTDPFVELNKAIALGYAQTADAGLKELLKIVGLNHYSIYHIALADFYRAVGNTLQSTFHYEKALSLSQSPSERNLITKKLKSIAN